jgi:hypothetical protein
MTMFPTKVAMSVGLLIFRFFSFVTIRSGSWLEGLGLLFYLLLWRGCCFLGLLDLSFCWATKDLLEVPAVLITPSCTSLFCSLIKASKKDSRVGF